MHYDDICEIIELVNKAHYDLIRAIVFSATQIETSLNFDSVRQIDVEQLEILAVKGDYCSRVFIPTSIAYNISVINGIIENCLIYQPFVAQYIMESDKKHIIPSGGAKFSTLSLINNSNDFESLREIVEKSKDCILADAQFQQTNRVRKLYTSSGVVNEFCVLSSLIRLSVQSRTCTRKYFLDFDVNNDIPIRNQFSTDQITNQYKLLSSGEMPFQGRFSGMLKFTENTMHLLLSVVSHLLTCRALASGHSLFSRNDFNKQIFNESISLVDLHSSKDSKYKFRFDAEGIPCQEKTLVKDGILIDALGTIEDAVRAALPCYGSAQFHDFEAPCVVAGASNLSVIAKRTINSSSVFTVIGFSSDTQIDPLTGLINGGIFGYPDDDRERFEKWQLVSSISEMFSNMYCALDTSDYNMHTISFLVDV